MIKIIKAKENSYYPTFQNIFRDIEHDKGMKNYMYILTVYMRVTE